jgi:hypothetical protein
MTFFLKRRHRWGAGLAKMLKLPKLLDVWAAILVL